MIDYPGAVSDLKFSRTLYRGHPNIPRAQRSRPVSVTGNDDQHSSLARIEAKPQNDRGVTHWFSMIVQSGGVQIIRFTMTGRAHIGFQ